MPPQHFCPLTESEFQRLTPEQREDYMTRLKADLDEKMVERARESQRISRAHFSYYKKNPSP